MQAFSGPQGARGRQGSIGEDLWEIEILDFSIIFKIFHDFLVIFYYFWVIFYDFWVIFMIFEWFFMIFEWFLTGGREV